MFTKSGCDYNQRNLKKMTKIMLIQQNAIVSSDPTGITAASSYTKQIKHNSAWVIFFLQSLAIWPTSSFLLLKLEYGTRADKA